MRQWKKAANYPNGAYVLYTEDKQIMMGLQRWVGLSGVQTYSEDGRQVGWDLIFPRPEMKRADINLKKRLLARCE